MKRMHDVLNIDVPAVPGEHDAMVGDVRVRVDIDVLCRLFAARAIVKRGHLVQLHEGAITVEAFNVRPQVAAAPAVKPDDPPACND